MTNVYHSLESGHLAEDWSDTSRLRLSNDWSGVAGIVGFKGDDMGVLRNSDARGVTATSANVYLAANRTDPNTYLTAGVAEFQIDDPTIAISGSGNAGSPYIALYLDATGRTDVTLSFTARDLESGADDSVQQIVVQYRLGDGGTWSNVPGGYVADASIANATMETHVSVVLPPEAQGAADLQVRIMTIDTSRYDEWIGIDDILVTSERDPDYRPDPVGIYTIQGAGHVSALAGKVVVTQGIVTAIDAHGFYLQSATGDGDAATSDAIYVQSGALAVLAVGDGVEVMGVVAEVVNGAGLTRTEIVGEMLDIASHGNALPAAVLVGDGGLLPPDQVIEDDGMTSFEWQTDGLDFWESLEGMRVTLDAPQVVSNTNGYGETYVVVSHGSGASGMTAHGGIAFGPGDSNPEIIQIDDKLGAAAGFDPHFTVGDQLTDVTGILSYSQNHYELLATHAVGITHDADLQRDKTTLKGDANHLTVASYNLDNLGPDSAKYAVLAADIVNNLAAPDVIALQKVMDADGTGAGTDLSGKASVQKLIDAIYARSGVLYTYVEIAPSAANSTDGLADANIRSAYLYRDDRVDLVEGSLAALDAAAFDGTRKPLVATWLFNGEEVTTVNVHFTTRFGSDPLWGEEQSPYAAGTKMRIAQAGAVGDYVQSLLALDPSAKVMVAGDWGGFWYEQAQTQLTDGGMLTNLVHQLGVDDRYSAIEDGNGQLLANAMISAGLIGSTQIDVVHINAEFAGSPRGSEYDPLVTSIHIPAGANIINGGNGKDKLVGEGAVDIISGGNGNDALYGNGADDDLLGGRGKDKLIGGDGNDWLKGGKGNDTLIGGAGADVFVFEKAGGNDIVRDFTPGVDMILLADGQSVLSTSVRDTDKDGVADLVVKLTGGGSFTLHGINSLDGILIDHVPGLDDLDVLLGVEARLAAQGHASLHLI